MKIRVSPHRAPAAATAAGGLLAPAALLELAVGRPAGAAATGSTDAAAAAAVGALDGRRPPARRLAALGGLRVGVEDPPAGLAGALVLHAQEAAVQRQVVADGVLQRRERGEGG